MKFAVPKALAWDCDSSNEVEGEYVIIEKAPGVQLYRKWGDMGGKAKLALTRYLVKLESQLLSIHFPASGSLYLRDSAEKIGERCLPFSKSIDSLPVLLCWAVGRSFVVYSV